MTCSCDRNAGFRTDVEAKADRIIAAHEREEREKRRLLARARAILDD